MFYYWESLGILQFPITSFKRGNLEGIGTKYHLSQFYMKYYKMTKELGRSFCGLYFSFHRVLLICDLNLAKQVLIQDFSCFANHGLYCNEEDDPVSANLFALENSKWKSMRQLLTPIFTSGKLKMMLGTMEEVANTMLKKLDTINDVEIKNVFSRYSTDIIGSVAFGIDVNSLDFENIHKKFKEINLEIYENREYMIKRMFRNEFKRLAKKLHMISLPESVSSFYINIARKTVEMRESDPSFVREDFISLLIELKKQNLLTIEQIAAQSLVFYVAG